MKPGTWVKAPIDSLTPGDRIRLDLSNLTGGYSTGDDEFIVVNCTPKQFDVPPVRAVVVEHSLDTVLCHVDSGTVYSLARNHTMLREFVVLVQTKGAL